MNRMLLLFIPVGAALAVPVMTLFVVFIERLNGGHGIREAAAMAFWKLWDWTLSEGAIYNQRYETFLIASAVAFGIGTVVALLLFFIGPLKSNQSTPHESPCHPTNDDGSE